LIVGSFESHEKGEHDGGRIVEMHAKPFDIGQYWFLLPEAVSKMSIAPQLLDEIPHFT
jgi:hypothetical protein